MATSITITTVLANAAAGLTAFAVISPIAVVGLVALAAASPADAQSAPMLRLRYQAAELRTDAGAGVIFDRIQRGAVRACYNGASIQHHVSARRCRNELTELMVAKLANPRVAGIHAASAPVQMAAR